MRAAVFQGPGHGLTIENVPDPTPGERQVVLKIEACGICGTDLSMTSGSGYLQSPVGSTPGHEYAGEVVAVGPGVERLAVGDRVTSLAVPAACGHCDNCRAGLQQWCSGDDKIEGIAAAYAEYVLQGEPQTARLPDDLSLADAALVEPLAVGLHGVALSGMRHGDDVVVLGAGPIGVATAYWARRHGARRVVVVATSNRREVYARALGASSFVVADTDLVGQVTEEVGGLPGIVFEAAGVPGALAQSVALVAKRGTVVGLGCCSHEDTWVPMGALFKEVRVQFSQTYTAGDYDHVMRTLLEDDPGPRAMVSSTVGLDALPERFELLRGSTTECKVMVKPWE